MRKELVNRIYWAPEYSNAFTLGASGSQITIQPDGSVHQHNDLMAPGDLIMFWHSRDNYQMAKSAPQLPLLQQGADYRIDIHGEAFPEKTVIYRMIFYDVQGHSIKKDYFRENSHEFTYPKQAGSYEVNILNAGNTDYYFQDFMITAADASEDAENDFWIQEPLGKASDPKLVLLIAAGTRFKTNFPELADYHWPYNILPVVAERMDSEKLTHYLNKLMQAPAFKLAGLVACSPQLSESVIDYARQDPTHRVIIVTNKQHQYLPFNASEIWQRKQLPVVKADAFEPDWPLLYTAINRIGGDSHG